MQVHERSFLRKRTVKTQLVMNSCGAHLNFGDNREERLFAVFDSYRPGLDDDIVAKLPHTPDPECQLDSIND